MSIHELSTAVTLPGFDIFGVPPTQYMVEKDMLSEYRPIATLDSQSAIQFEVPSSIDEYIRLEDMELYLKTKFKSSKTTDADWAKVAPVNYTLHSMIKQVDLYVGDTAITSSLATYSYRSYFEAMLGFSSDAKKTHLTSALWRCDENDKTEGYPDTNLAKYIKGGKELELMGKLHLDTTFQCRYLLGGCKLTVRILLNSPNFYLMKSDDGNIIEANIIDAKLYIHKCKVNPAVAIAHDSALKMAPAKYPITHSRVKAFTINSGRLDATITNIHNGQHPRRIFVACVANDAFIGSFKKNPFYFKSYKISHIAAFLDGVQYPSLAYTPDFQNRLSLQAYRGLMQSLDMLGTDSLININRDNYENGNTVFGFNFAPDLSNGCGASGHVNPIKYGSLSLEIRFKDVLPEVITVLVYCEWDKILEVDYMRNAKVDLN